MGDPKSFAFSCRRYLNANVETVLTYYEKFQFDSEKKKKRDQKGLIYTQVDLKGVHSI